MIRSRRSSSFEQRAKLQIIKLLLFSFILVIIAVVIGPKILVALSVFSEQFRNNPEKTEAKHFQPLLVPNLDPLPELTKENKISVTGRSQPGLQIEILVNDVPRDKTIVIEDSTFYFKDIRLSPGENTISVLARNSSGQESSLSDKTVIFYKNSPPDLELFEPEDGKKINGERIVTIKGKTEPDSEVFINDRLVVVGINGSFDYNLNLQDGENKLKIVARDGAGNETIQERKVIYAP